CALLASGYRRNGREVKDVANPRLPAGAQERSRVGINWQDRWPWRALLRGHPRRRPATLEVSGAPLHRGAGTGRAVQGRAMRTALAMLALWGWGCSGDDRAPP